MSDYGELSDADLLKAASRDRLAFGELYDRHADGLYRWARSAGLGESDALDLVSELFARAWVSRKRFRDRGDGNAAPWLFGIARNLLVSHRRSGQVEARARKRMRIPPVAEADAVDAVDARVDAAASRAELERALEALPKSQRDAVRLRVVDGLEYPDIAVRCSSAAPRRRLASGYRSGCASSAPRWRRLDDARRGDDEHDYRPCARAGRPACRDRC